MFVNHFPNIQWRYCTFFQDSQNTSVMSTMQNSTDIKTLLKCVYFSSLGEGDLIPILTRELCEAVDKNQHNKIVYQQNTFILLVCSNELNSYNW